MQEFAECPTFSIVSAGLEPHSIGPYLKLVMNFNSRNIHSVSKITLYVHEKKEAADLSATDD